MNMMGNGTGSKKKTYLIFLLVLVVIFFVMTYFTSKKQADESQHTEHYEEGTSMETIYNSCMTAMATKWGNPEDGRVIQLLVESEADGKAKQVAIQVLDIAKSTLYYISVDKAKESGYDATLFKQSVSAEDAALFKDRVPVQDANAFMKEFFTTQPTSAYSLQYFNVSQISANQTIDDAQIIGDTTGAKAYYLYNLYEKDADNKVTNVIPYLTAVK